MKIEFGDNVKFIDNEITRNAGIALKDGVCVVFTTPSRTDVSYIGNTDIDYAVSIELNENSEIIWTTQDLLEFVDHGEGQEIIVGNTRATRRADGSWKEEKIEQEKKWNWFENGNDVEI